MQRTKRIGRRDLLMGGTVAGAAAAMGSVTAASGKQPAGADGIDWLDYTPPRPWAAGARVGNIVYLAGEIGSGADITEQTEDAFAKIRSSLQAFGSDLEHVFRMTVYLVNIADQAGFAQVRSRILPRTVPSTLVAVSRLVPPDGLVEIDVIALVPNA